MTTFLIVATGATVVLNDVKAAEAVTLMADHGVKVGLTSMRGLLNGSLTKACGVEVVADAPMAKAAEEPVNEPKAKEAEPVKVKEPVVNADAAMPVADLLGLGNVADDATGWGSYLCKPESLRAKRERLVRKLRKIAKSNKLADLNVQMINGEGSVDSLMFTRADGTVAFTVTPKKRWGNDMNSACVTDGTETLTGSWKEVVAFFANPAEEKPETPEPEAQAA